jgi:replicative DNA helicase
MDEAQQALARRMIHTPPEVAQLGLDAIKRMVENEHRAISIGVAGLRDYFAPLLPGEITVVMAQTSNFKTGFMDGWAHNVAMQFEHQGRTEIIVMIHLEETVETQAHVAFAREMGADAGELARGKVKDWTKLQGAADRIGTIPIFRVSDSVADDVGIENFHLSNIMNAVELAADGALVGRPLKIGAMFVDYLQALPLDPTTLKFGMEESRRLQVRQDMYRLRDAAKRFDCPLVLGVQAKQHLDGALGLNMLTPGVYDGEETSSIAQRADRIISLWMPKQTHRVGQTIEHGELRFQVDENLLFVRVCKQRGGLPAGKVFRCRINFATNNVAPEAGQ